MKTAKKSKNIKNINKTKNTEHNNMRVKELQEIMNRKKIDACLLYSNDPNFTYLIEEKHDSGLLIIPKKEKPLLLKSPLDNKSNKVKTIMLKNPKKEFQRMMKDYKLIGLNYDKITISQKKSFKKKSIDISEILLELRRQKSTGEIRKIKTAIRRTEIILKKIIVNFNFKTEKEVVRFIELEACKMNCELAFKPVVASGKNAVKPHHEATSKPIQKGFLVIDLGLKYNGYCADITRTIDIGKPTLKEKKLYNELLEIQGQAIKKIRPKIKTSEIDFFVRKKLGSKEKYFIHSLGHGIGLDVHEKPSISKLSSEVLKIGDVITIEPGIYPSYGIRIEDDILVDEKKPIILSKFPKKLIMIPKV